MKYFLPLLFFCYTALAQEGRAIISLDKDNIVYRGIDNVLKIGVPGTGQSEVTVSAPGDLKRDESKPGYYKWNVTAVSGTRAKITVTYKLDGGKTVAEDKEFRIMSIPPQYAYIENQQANYKCSYHLTRDQIARLKLNTTLNVYHELGDKYIKVTGFWLYMPNDTVGIDGNTIPDSVKVKIEALQTGSIITINHIRRYNPDPGLDLKGIPPLTIQVADYPLPYKQDDIPTPVIYNTRYETVYRGTGNRFSISVPGAKSYTVTGPGVTQYGDGSFDLNLPGDYKGNHVFVDVEAVTKTDSVVKNRYMYVVKNIETRMLINGQGCEKCIVQQSLKELENARVSIVSADIRPFNTIGVVSFTVILPNGNTIQVNGDHISDEAHFLIKQYTKPGDIITIDQINCRIPACECNLPKYPIKIMLVE